jgi:uncharacterized membrane protein HdeD (DUF308 family)
MSEAINVEVSDVRDIPWWLLLLEGIALIILGLLWISKPGMTTEIVVLLLGIYWLVAGIFKLISIFLDHSMWGWKLFAGILGIIAGIIVIQHPLWSTWIIGTTLIIILGIVGIIYGGIGIYQAFKGAGWGTGILGALSVLIGLVLLFNVWVFTLSLPLVLGILSIVGGIVAIVLAFRQKP